MNTFAEKIEKDTHQTTMQAEERGSGGGKTAEAAADKERELSNDTLAKYEEVMAERVATKAVDQMRSLMGEMMKGNVNQLEEKLKAKLRREELSALVTERKRNAMLLEQLREAKAEKEFAIDNAMANSYSRRDHGMAVHPSEIRKGDVASRHTRELYSCRCPTGCQFPVVGADGKEVLFTTPSPTQACRAQHLHEKRPDYKPDVLRLMSQKPDPCGDKGPTEEMLLRFSLCPTLFLWSFDVRWRDEFEALYAKHSLEEETIEDAAIQHPEEEEVVAVLLPTVIKRFFGMPPPSKNVWILGWEDFRVKIAEALGSIVTSKLAVVLPYPLPEDAVGHLQSAVSSVSGKTDILLVAAPGKEAGDDLEEVVKIMDGFRRETGQLHVILPTTTVEEMEGRPIWSIGKDLNNYKFWMAIEHVLKKRKIQWPCLQKKIAPPPEKKRKAMA